MVSASREKVLGSVEATALSISSAKLPDSPVSLIELSESGQAVPSVEFLIEKESIKQGSSEGKRLK